VTNFTDSHCHLNALKLAAYDGSIDCAIAAAYTQGVVNMLSVCTRLEDLPSILEVVERHDSIWASVGVHPLDLEQEESVKNELIRLAEHKKIVAIGETGLDFHYSEETKKAQINSFIEHLQAGAETKLPVIVHTREAKAETLDLLKEFACRESTGVLHCFTEDIAMAKVALDLGYYISLSGIVTFKNAEQLRDVAKFVPDDRLLIETDSPYLAPVPFRGKPNEPRYVVEVGKYIAKLRNVSDEKLANMTTNNFFNLFNKALRS